MSEEPLCEGNPSERPTAVSPPRDEGCGQLFLGHATAERIRELQDTAEGSRKEVLAAKSLSEAVQEDWALLGSVSADLAHLAEDEALRAHIPAAQENVREAQAHTFTHAAGLLLDRQRLQEGMAIGALDLMTSEDTGLLSAERLAIHVQLAWSAPKLTDSLRHLQYAGKLDHAGEFEGYWHVAETLIKGRHAIREGDYDRASRLAISAAEQVEECSDLHLISLELLAKAYQQSGLDGRERLARVQWIDAFASANPPDTPAARARRLETSASQPGLLAASRWQEILQAGSRLAILLEGHGDNRRAAGIYRDMLSHGWQEWCDPEVPDAGSIRKRYLAVNGEAAEDHAGVLHLIRPGLGRGFLGRPTAEEAEDLVNRIANDPEPTWRGVILGEVECHENQFAYDRARGEAEGQLLEAITNADRADPLFEVRSVHAQTMDGDCVPHLLLSYSGEDRALDGVSFAIRVLPVGRQAAWTMYTMLTVQEPSPDHLALLRRCLNSPRGDELPGILQAKALALVRAAGRQVSRHAGNFRPGKGTTIRW